jgi:hypothetical protein
MRYSHAYPYPTFSKLDLAAGSDWITITKDMQSFTDGAWDGTFTPTADGDSTKMTIEIDWVSGTVPQTQPTNVGYSTFDTGISFDTSNKARIFACIMEFTDISAIVNPLHRLNTGLYVAEKSIGTRIASTAGAYYGGEISDPFGTANFNQFSLESITAANLVSTSGDTVPATINGFLLLMVISPSGEITLVETQPINTASGVNISYSALTKRKTSGFQTPTAGETIKIGAWFGTAKTAQQVGQNYVFDYRIKYAYKELS